jgi:TRAP-type C4-dicarboxylate transport system substrate-binding protein
MRRYSVVIILSLGFFLSMLLPASAADAPIKLIYESVYPKGHMRFLVVDDLLDRIEQKSDGRIAFERHYGGEPVPQKEALNGLTHGAIDLLMAYPTYYDGKIAIGDWQQLPANFRRWEDCWELAVKGQVATIMDQAYTKTARVKYITCTPVAPYNFQIAKSSKKIKKFEDFQGLKIRSAGGSASIAIKLLGGSPVMTIGGEYYQAMQTGIVDAGLMTTYSLKQYRLWEVADQVVNPPLIGYAVGFLWMNQKSWDKLPNDLKALFKAEATSRDLWEKWIKIYEQDQDGPIIKEAKEKGVEFFVLPPEEAERMYAATKPVWDWYIEECQKQGLGDEAREVAKLIHAKFDSK